ncbi:MAG: hypothetical protein ACXVIH_11445 [Ilumatobacteraceae bacterium]
MNRLLACLLATVTLSACAHDEKKEGTTAAAEGGNQPAPAQTDRSRCDPAGKKVVELDVSNDGKPDVWKVYAQTVDNGAKVDVLTCKEVDLNFDGKKDMWVYYDNGGNVTLEEFDLDFDGKLDMWTYRQNGKIVRQELDTNFDTKPDVWKFFEGEKLARIERSSKKNGKVDVWEYYEGGKLDRIGYDTSGSGQVDRWDRAPEEESAAATPAASTGLTGKPAAPLPPTATPEATPAPAPAPKKK